MTQRRKGPWAVPIPDPDGMNLDLDAPAGRYRVDCFAELCPKRKDEDRYHEAWHADPVRCVRETTSLVGRAAVEEARLHAGETVRAEQERTGLAALDDLRTALVRVAAASPSGASFVSPPGVDPFSADEALRALLNTANGLRAALDEFNEKYSRAPPRRPGPGAAKPLERAFVANWRDVGWSRVTGTEQGAPRSRQGKFVRLMTAAWHDLGLPIDDHQEAEGSGVDELLGRYAERSFT